MGNSHNKSSLRKSQSVPDTQKLSLDAPVFDKQKSVSQLRLNEKSTKPGKAFKKLKQKHEDLPQLPPAEAMFLPEFPLRGDIEELDFDIINVIARGAYGNVIKVLREDEKKFYAVKVLDKAQIIEEGAIRQCKDEATIQSMAGDHPLVVKAHEYWQSRRSLYIVLDYIPYGDMFTLWTFHGAFPEELVQVYIGEMATVIDFLHNASVIYRDIKMENILFNAKGHIQLTDFGLAKWLQGGDQTRTVCGTLQYMAPEVLSVYPYNHSADWWSLGILMYAMLAGRYPVDGADSHTKMAQRVFECDFLLPSNISDSAQDVINRLLTKSPHKRLCDVSSLQDLPFFENIFFPDLIEQKLNPVDVVPEDFFPMSGQNWAPHLLTEEEQRHFDQFDESNETITDDPSYSHVPHYGSHLHSSQHHHHHPDAVHRLHQPQPYNHRDQLGYNMELPSPKDQPPHGHLYYHHPTPTSLDLKKPFPDSHGEPSAHGTGPSDMNGSDHSSPSDRKFQNSEAAGYPGGRQSQQGSDTGSVSQQKGVAWNNKNENVACINKDKNVDWKNKDENVDMKMFTGMQSLSYGGSNVMNSLKDYNRQSLDGGMNTQNIISSSTVTRSSNNPGQMSWAPSVNNINGSRGNTNRKSVGPEFIPVEAPPTVILKTPRPASSTQSSFHQMLPGFQAQSSSGPVSQNYLTNKQTASSSMPSEEKNSQASSQSSGFNTPGNSYSTNQGYKAFETSPTITLPLQQITFNPNSGTFTNKDLQPPPPTIISNFSTTNSTYLPHPSSTYQRLDQKTVTLNSEPQTSLPAQRPTPPAKPVPAQRPPIASKPLVPVKPIPAPRHSIRLNKKNTHPHSWVSLASNQEPIIQNFNNSNPNQSQQGPNISPSNRGDPYPSHTSSQGTSIPPLNRGDSYTSNPNQQGPNIPPFNRRDSYPSNANQGQQVSPYYHSHAGTSSDSLNQQQDWRNSPEPHDPIKTVPGASSNQLPGTSYLGPDTSTKNSITNNQNLEWNLPVGTKPSFV